MRRALTLLALVMALRPSSAGAQPQPDHPPKVIALRPAAEPVPALKYRLVPERRSLVPGNAAIFYHRGILLLTQNRTRLAGMGQKEPEARAGGFDERTIARLITCPLAEFSRDEAGKHLALFEGALNEVELGAQRLTCDWEFDQRKEGYSLLLPEIQEMRSLARLVALRARLAIVDGKTGEAMHWIETGLVMGRHVSQGPIVIQALVGVAIEGVMARCLEDLIQAPGTPSLYWALADRPRPFTDMRYSMEGERYLLERELPELSELDRGPWSLDEARRFTDALQHKLFTLASGAPIPGSDGAVPMDIPALARRLGIASMAAKIYPDARRSLIAQGRPEAEVEAMPVIQLAALHTMQEYQRLRDESYKWLNVPYWQSYNRVDSASLSTVEEKLSNPLLALFRRLTPALNAARMAALRIDRQLDVLQCIEAIRLHAAAQADKLPASLEAISDAPVPIDPATGKPFLYEVTGDWATLSAPVPPGFNRPADAIRYVLRLAR